MKIIVAIDGFAASGKSTIAKDAIRIENGSQPLDDILQNLFTLFYKLTKG